MGLELDPQALDICRLTMLAAIAKEEGLSHDQDAERARLKGALLCFTCALSTSHALS